MHPSYHIIYEKFRIPVFGAYVVFRYSNTDIDSIYNPTDTSPLWHYLFPRTCPHDLKNPDSVPGSLLDFAVVMLCFLFQHVIQWTMFTHFWSCTKTCNRLYVLLILICVFSTSSSSRCHQTAIILKCELFVNAHKNKQKNIATIIFPYAIQTYAAWNRISPNLKDTGVAWAWNITWVGWQTPGLVSEFGICMAYTAVIKWKSRDSKIVGGVGIFVRMVLVIL